MTNELRNYYIAIGRYLDKTFEVVDTPYHRKMIERILDDDVPDYYNRNISDEMAAEFIANKLRLPRLIKMS